MSGKPEFMNNEKTVLVFNEPNEAKNVIDCLAKCIKVKLWVKNSRIIILSGHHHTNPDGKVGATRNIYTHYDHLMEQLEREIEEMEYTFEFLEMKTVPFDGDSKGNMLYMLAKGSLANLRAKLQHVLESDCQNVLVFATFASLSNKGRLLLVTLQ